MSLANLVTTTPRRDILYRVVLGAAHVGLALALPIFYFYFFIGVSLVVAAIWFLFDFVIQITLNRDGLAPGDIGYSSALFPVVHYKYIIFGQRAGSSLSGFLLVPTG